jgi:hypothetical protein
VQLSDCQAKRMETRSEKFIPPVAIGDFVTLPVPDVDRDLTDPPNLRCRLVDIDFTTSLHELACVRSKLLRSIRFTNCLSNN